MHEAVSGKSSEIADACRRHGVVRLDVFGSAARAVDFEPGRSDADFLVDFDEGYGLNQILDLADDLESVLQLSVDLITAKGLEGCDNRRIRASILADRRVVYER